MLLLVDDTLSNAPKERVSNALREAIRVIAGPPDFRMAFGFFPVEASVRHSVGCSSNADCGEYGPCGAFGCGAVVGGGPVDSCDLVDYAAPQVRLMGLPSGWPALGGATYAVGGRRLATLTVALKGAAQYLKAESRPGYRSTVVVVTDGHLTGCLVNDVQTAAAAAETARLSDPPVFTYVLDIGSVQYDMNPVAVAGGTGSSYVAVEETAIQAAFREIRVAEGCL